MRTIVIEMRTIVVEVRTIVINLRTIVINTYHVQVDTDFRHTLEQRQLPIQQVASEYLHASLCKPHTSTRPVKMPEAGTAGAPNCIQKHQGSDHFRLAAILGTISTWDSTYEAQNPQARLCMPVAQAGQGTVLPTTCQKVLAGF